MNLRARTVLVVAVAVVLAGCGGAGEQTPAPTGATTAPPGGGSPATVTPSAGADLDAQKLLRAARNTALTYYMNHARTYVGYDATYANDLEPTIVFTTGATVAGQVSIREVTPDTILLTTIGASGNPLCIGESEGRAGDTAMGLVDASTFSACVGGWPGG
jgi:hypothetical protein